MSRDDTRGRRPLRHSLALRFGAALCLGAAVLFLVQGYWSITRQRRHMVRLTEQEAERASSIIQGAVRDGMLLDEDDHSARVGRTIRTIASSEGVRRVRLLDRDGRVRHSSGPGVETDRLPIVAFQCQICHAQDPIPAKLEANRRMREIQIDGRAPLLNVVEPIPNEPSCWTAACHVHEEGRRVLGIIDIELPLTHVSELITESEKQMGIALLLGLAGLLLLAMFLTWRLVVRPMGALAAASERVAVGDLTTRVPVPSSTEMARTANSFNVMVERLQKARGQLEDWSRTLEERVTLKTRELSEAHDRMLVVEKMAALGKLAAVVAHEINNPLAGIATYAKLLRKKFERLEAQATEAGIAVPDCFDRDSLKALELVESEASRCGTIVKNLLLFSRTPGARFAEEDLGALLERCALLVHHKAELQEVVVQVALEPNVPKVECDASQIQQVILALTMNAIESMPDGGTVRLELARDVDGTGVQLQVVDTGCGIPREALPHVFEPFFSTKQEGEGVGLGLSVVYGIVERHHGRVSVSSIPGEGTAFRVQLPLRQPKSAEAEEEGVVS